MWAELWLLWKKVLPVASGEPSKAAVLLLFKLGMKSCWSAALREREEEN